MRSRQDPWLSVGGVRMRLSEVKDEHLALMDPSESEVASHTHAHTHAHACTHARTRMHARTHTHTHTHPNSRAVCERVGAFVRVSARHTLSRACTHTRMRVRARERVV